MNKTYSLSVTDTQMVLCFIEEGKEKGNRIVLPNLKEPRVVATLPVKV